MHSLRVRLPRQCKECGAAGTVAVESTLIGTTVTLNWNCRACGHVWPISPEEQQIERRGGTSDRRKTPRNDRRRK